MKIFYHSRDLDGYTSGAICKRKYPEAELIGFDYGQEFPFDTIETEPIIMVDVSLPMDKMMELNNLCGGQLTWIDHHKSAIDDFEKYNEGTEPFCEAILQDGIAACEITWKHFFKDTLMPRTVELLGKYDTWRNRNPDEWDNQIMPFQYGMRMRCDSAKAFNNSLFENTPEVNNLIAATMRDGTTILTYQKQMNAKACEKAFEVEFHGLKGIALNGAGFNSQVFESVYDPNKHDLMVPFQWDGSQWTISLYTTHEDVDCAALAKEWGGGGHKKAAGFIVVGDLPFDQQLDEMEDPEENGTLEASEVNTVSSTKSKSKKKK